MTVTDNARAEAERRWGDRRTSDRLPSDWLDEGMASGFVLGAQWAAGRAETRCMCDWGDSAPPEVNTADIHRPGCPAAGRAETPIVTSPKGASKDAETTTATVEGAARVLYAAVPPRPDIWRASWDDTSEILRDEWRHYAQALDAAGLLATARTRPTREQIAQAITSGFLGTKHSSEFWKKGTARNAQDNYLRAADAVLALLAERPTEAGTTTDREEPHG